MIRDRFPHLDRMAIRVLELLGTPVYVYSFTTQKIAWGNDAAIRFWNARDLEELRQRALTPYSQSTTQRLKEYLAAFRRGDHCEESWTVYPKGDAISAIARCSGVSLENHPEAMLVEMKSLGLVDLPVSELRAIEALRHSSAMILMLSVDGDVLLLNPAAKNFFEDPESRDHNGAASLRAMLADPDDYDRLINEVCRVGRVYRTVGVVGESAPVHAVQLTRIADPATGDSAILWVQQDVSDFRNLTKQLAASEAALDLVLDVSAVPSLLISAPGGKLLKANFAARRILQIDSADDDEGRPSIFAETTAYEEFFDCVQAQRTCTTIARMSAGKKRTFWGAVSGTWLDSEHDGSVLLMINDVDDLQQAAAELESALNVEREISEMQRRMLEIASHEFRTPLAVIDGAAQRIARRSQSITPEELTDLTGRIRNFVNRLNSLLDNTLERARNNLGAVHCEKALGSIQDAIEAVSSSFSDRAKIEIDKNIGNLPKFWFDRVLIEQAFVSLIENAMKYSRGSARISFSCATTDDSLELYVRDFGIGILPKDREIVFSERVRGANVGQRPGSGLGLYIVRGIFRAHGGDIQVAENDGPGTILKMTLPLIPSAAQSASLGE